MFKNLNSINECKTWGGNISGFRNRETDTAVHSQTSTKRNYQRLPAKTKSIENTDHSNPSLKPQTHSNRHPQLKPSHITTLKNSKIQSSANWKLQGNHNHMKRPEQSFSHNTRNSHHQNHVSTKCYDGLPQRILACMQNLSSTQTRNNNHIGFMESKSLAKASFNYLVQIPSINILQTSLIHAQNLDINPSR
jgi:hypothetical protein